MYEIWLALNIVYEIARLIWPTIAIVAAVWLALLWVARGRMGRPALTPALFTGAVVAVLGVLTIPSLTHSSLSEAAYWVDWVSLIGLALGFGALAAVLVFPMIGLLRKPA